MNWSQPICERDWIAKHTVVQDDERVAIKRPVRLTDPVVELCAFCGELTIFGVYIRVNPLDVPYPKSDADRSRSET